MKKSTLSLIFSIETENASTESLYIYKFFKKGKLSLELIDPYFKKACFSIIKDESLSNLRIPVADDTSVSSLIYVVDTIVSLVVNYEIVIKSLQYVNCLKGTNCNKQDFEKVLSFIDKSANLFNNFVINKDNDNVNSINEVRRINNNVTTTNNINNNMNFNNQLNPTTFLPRGINYNSSFQWKL
jgi:hypothetical protein